MSELISLNNVSKLYPMGSETIHALDNVSLSINRGDFWAIMGPSGSGKSTMMNILGCLDRPSSGTYRLAGKNVAGLDDDALSDIRLQHLGFVFQSFNLIPQLTVRENIELPLFYLGAESGESAEKAGEIARLVGLADRLNHRPAELSGGQQQRVAIARSLINDPGMILADEPTGNLDSASGDQIIDILKNLNTEGKTVILITHERSIADHAGSKLHMHDGKIAKMEGC
jgi:putative ABC transport system ATP-binding protein